MEEVGNKQVKKSWLSAEHVQLVTDYPDVDESNKESEKIATELPQVEQLSEMAVHETPDPAESPNTENSTHHFKKRGLAVALVALVLVIGMGVGGGLYAKNHSVELVKIANLAATRNVYDPTFQKQLTLAAAAYRLTIQDASGAKKQFSLADMGISPDVQATLSDAHSQHKMLPWRTVTLPLKFHSDTAKLAAFIATNAVQTKQPAQDAGLSISGGVSVLTPEHAGQGFSLADATHTIMQAASTLQSTPFKLSPSAIKPQIVSADLQAKKQLVDKALQQTVTLSINNSNDTVSAADIGNWIDLTPVPKAKTVDVTVDSGKIAAYIDSLVEPLVQTPSDQVVQTAADGSTTVLIPGHGGIQVTSENSVAANIANKLLAGTGISTTLPLSYSSYRTISTGTYPKWLLVDTNNKRMYDYENTNLVRTFLVSAGAPATPTVTGQYAIYAKYLSQNMSGNNADGSRYFQPNVQWINYFYKDYAVHGNYWRPTSYFGNINSSHGCVGIVNSDAEWVYDWAPIGTPVIIHD